MYLWTAVRFWQRLEGCEGRGLGLGRSMTLCPYGLFSRLSKLWQEKTFIDLQQT